MKDKIPKGVYCYTVNNLDTKTGIRKIIPCPYHYINPEKPEQMNGGCKFIGVEDDDDDGYGLLWDMVKECGINR